MKRHFLTFALGVNLLLGIGGFGFNSASAQIVDDTEASVTETIQILRGRQAGIRKAKGILENHFNFPADVPEVHITLEDMPDRLRGSYQLYWRIISISNRDLVASYSSLITFHEVGHWFDNRVMAPRFMAQTNEFSEASSTLTVKELDAWRAAIANSRTFRTLDRYIADPKSNPDRKQFAIYLKSPQETWARSFCQYVATKSKDAELQAQMKNFVERDWPWNGSWSAEDFAPIEKSLDELFAKYGWLKPVAASDTRDG